MTAARRILLTGGSGLLGGELAGGLIERGHAVTAVVHRSRTICRNDGTVVASTDGRGAAPYPGSLRLLAGDLGRPALGLDARTLEAAAAGHDLVIHCAAATGFGLKEEVYRSVNVEGTRHVLELARRGGMPVIHVSTAYVCGARNGAVAEAQVEPGQMFANHYEESKAEAERLVLAAGVPAVIARPSIVVGNSQSGRLRRSNGIYAIYRLMAEGHIRTMPATPGATLDLVPIDHVAAGLVDLTERIDAATGGIFHLTSSAPMPVSLLRESMCERPGFACPEFVAPEAFDLARLPAAEQRLHRKVAAFYASYFGRDLRFDDSAFRALTGRSCPPGGMAFLRRLIDYALASGYLRMEHGSEVSPRRFSET